MHRFVFVLFILAAAGVPAYGNSVDDASGKIAAELQKQYAAVGSQDIAMADFVTVNMPRSTFGDYLTEAVGEALKSKPSTTIIDQQRVDDVLKKRNFFFNTPFDFQVLNELSYDIFQSTQETPTSYCYGQIKESGDDIKISVKMVNAITGAAIASATVTFPSDETTDRLLGKPLRPRKPQKPDTVVVVKERIVEKVVEKQAAAQVNSGAQGFKIQEFVLRDITVEKE